MTALIDPGARKLLCRRQLVMREVRKFLQTDDVISAAKKLLRREASGDLKATKRLNRLRVIVDAAPRSDAAKHEE